MYEVNGILYAGPSSKMMKIRDAEISQERAMVLTFESGEKRIFDTRLLQGEVYEPLQDEAVLRRFQIVRGAVTWMDGTIDCDPAYMYAHSSAWEMEQ
ncbi:MAG TPA: DUF2442 domain-containing protein [Candidatus Ventrimonas merdavium]|nr:DUF2442 domain-containing protein [Candidatus Ventrimonas merdavium]